MGHSKTFVNVYTVQKCLIFEMLHLLGLTKSGKNASIIQKCKCSLKLSHDFFFTLYTSLQTHKALEATVETQGLGRSPSQGSMGGLCPPIPKNF